MHPAERAGTEQNLVRTERQPALEHPRLEGSSEGLQDNGVDPFGADLQPDTDVADG